MALSRSRRIPGTTPTRSWPTLPWQQHPSKPNVTTNPACSNGSPSTTNRNSPLVIVARSPAAINWGSTAKYMCGPRKPSPTAKKNKPGVTATRMRAHHSASPIQWCGGGVLDWNLLDNQRTQSSGAVNPGDWAWAFNPTDRARPSISVASADVFHIYNLRLSYLHSPPRTFDLEQVHAPTAADSTSWANLHDPTLADTGIHTEHIVSRILDARTCTNNSIEYLVRWYGHSADSDTWVSSRTVKDTNAFERFCHTERPGNNDAGAARQWLRKRDSNPSDDSGSPPPTWLAPSAWAYSEVYDAVTPVESPLRLPVLRSP